MSQVSSFTIVLVRGAVYQKTFELTDDSGTPITLSSSSIIVTPNGASEVDWTQGNGKFTVVSPGVYNLALTATDTAGYSWSSGKWRWSVVQSGDANPCLTEGLCFVKDC